MRGPLTPLTQIVVIGEKGMAHRGGLALRRAEDKPEIWPNTRRLEPHRTIMHLMSYQEI